MRKLLDWYHMLLNTLLGVSVALLIIPVTLQMVSRLTGLIPAWIWTEEMARFFFIWMVMLGAMVAVREKTHFDVDVWPELSWRGDAMLEIGSTVLVLVFALVFVWGGVKFVSFGWNQTSELADLPMPFIFIAWPLTGATWLLFCWERLAKAVKALVSGAPLPEGKRDIATGSFL